MTALNSTGDGPSMVPRVILPLAQWPSGDQCLWLKCCDGQGPYGMDNRAVRWGPRRRKIIQDGYGRFLSWRKQIGDLASVTDPIARITPDTVSAFMKHMDKSGLSSVSLGMQVGTLSSIVQAFAPKTTNAALTSQVVTLKAAIRAWLVLHFTQAAGFASTPTLKQATDIAAATNAAGLNSVIRPS